MHSGRKYSCCSVPFPPDLRTGWSQDQSPDILWKVLFPVLPWQKRRFLPIHFLSLALHCLLPPFPCRHLLPAGRAVLLPSGSPTDPAALPPLLSERLHPRLPAVHPEEFRLISTDILSPQQGHQMCRSFLYETAFL